MRHLVLVIALGLCPSFALGQVTYERILNADKEPGNWLTYSGNYSSHRYSPLDEITRGNVASLRPVWVYQTGGGGCNSDAECDDGQFCNGAETCVSGSCQGGSDPCPGQGCDEGIDECTSCSLLPKGAPRTDNAECCSNKCKGPRSGKTCR